MKTLNLKLFSVNYVSNLFNRQLQRYVHSNKKLAQDNSAPQYCMKLVEQYDHENFLCTLLLSGEQRRHAFALRAFNVELATCSNDVSDDTILKLKLQFWQDSIDNCYKTERSYVDDHPVLQELKSALDTHKLNKFYLNRLITARDRPSNQQFVKMKHLEDYAEQAFASVLHLLVQLTGVKDVKVDHAVSHLGKASGITTLLRSIPLQDRTKPMCVPQELLIKHGVNQERILRHKDGDKEVENCIFEVASAAHGHLETVRQLSDDVPPEVRKLFLPAVAVERYLDRLRNANFRLTDPRCLQRDSLLPMSLYWYSMRGKY